MRWRIFLILVAATGLTGCSNIEHKPRGFSDTVVMSSSEQERPRKIVIFFDGTANDEGSDTNIKRLHSLVTLQDRGDIASLYILGVGTNWDALGAISGSGINARVRIAYEFILNHYRGRTAKREADEVYIFGFSRGAFSARILTTMLYFAGIVEEVKDPGEPRKYTSNEIANAVHEAAFPGFGYGDVDDSDERPKNLKEKLKDLKLASVLDSNGMIPVKVKVLGLWDSVEALGLPDLRQKVTLSFNSKPPHVDVDNPNKRYGEKLCNVEWAFHAMSIDDNRATTFTPLLISRSHLFARCPFVNDGNKKASKSTTFYSPLLDDKGNVKAGHLQEVWFSGAHSDVGGGYLSGSLSNVSLNWMLAQLNLADADLLPKRSGIAQAEGEPIRYVREDVFGGSHDPTAGIWKIYPRVSRDLVTYSLENQSLWKSKLCVHESVFKRRRLIAHQNHEYDQLVLNEIGKIQLNPGPYGKGWAWEWLRQRPPQDQPLAYAEIDVERYPVCTLMTKAGQVERRK